MEAGAEPEVSPTPAARNWVTVQSLVQPKFNASLARIKAAITELCGGSGAGAVAAGGGWSHVSLLLAGTAAMTSVTQSRSEPAALARVLILGSNRTSPALSQIDGITGSKELGCSCRSEPAQRLHARHPQLRQAGQ